MKRRAAPNRQAAGVSLFPFLAVLLCTMGALIVVLVVIARQARVQVAEAAQPPAEDELAIKRADLEWRISQLRESREATKKLLADKQTELGHLEEHSRRLRDQLDELAAARERLNQTAAGDERDQAKLKSELDRLHYRVAGLRNELGKLMEKAREKQQSYAVIPYHGPNETYRRPIYIECRSTGVVFQPSGLTLTEQDFAIDAGMGSPLASALRAAKEYYRGNTLKGEGETGSAYPLLIVRPDGILAYDFAKQVLDESGLEFGYELVAQDWSIEFPPADPMLVLAMKQAVGEGRMRLAYLAGAAPGLFFNRRDVSFRAVSHGGYGVGGGPGGGAGLHRGRSIYSSGRPAGLGGPSNASGSAAGGTGTADNPYLDALAQEEAGKGSGFGKGSTKGSEVGGQRPGGAWPGGQGGSGPAGTGGMGGIGISSGNAGESFAANGDQRSRAGGRGPGLGGPASGRVAQGPGSSREVAEFAHDGSGAGRGGSGFKGHGSGSNSPGGPSAGVALSGGPSGNRPPTFNAGAAGGATNARGVGAGAELTSANGTGPGAGGQGGIDARGVGGTARSSQGEVAMATRTGTGPATRAGATGGASASGSPNTAGSALATDDDTSRGNAAAGGPAGSYAAGTSMRASAAGQLASSARGGSGASGPAADGSTQRGGGVSGSSTGGASGSNGASSSAGSPAGGSMGSNMMQPGQLGTPMPTISMGAQPPSDQTSPSRRPTKRERNWANPDASTSNVPIERRIHIICDAEHLTIMPEGRGARGMKVIKLSTHTEDSLDELVSAVWDKIDSWGTAGRGMYWRPKLQMVIEPGGQRRYTELQALLADSGFDVHGRPRTVKRR